MKYLNTDIINTITLFCKELSFSVVTLFKFESEVKSRIEYLIKIIKELAEEYDKINIIDIRDYITTFNDFMKESMYISKEDDDYKLCLKKIQDDVPVPDKHNIISHKSVILKLRSGEFNQLLNLFKNVQPFPKDNHETYIEYIYVFPDRDLNRAWTLNAYSPKLAKRMLCATGPFIINSLADIIYYSNNELEFRLFYLAINVMARKSDFFIESLFFNLNVPQRANIEEIFAALYKSCISMAGCWRVSMKRRTDYDDTVDEKDWKNKIVACKLKVPNDSIYSSCMSVKGNNLNFKDQSIYCQMKTPNSLLTEFLCSNIKIFNLNIDIKDYIEKTDLYIFLKSDYLQLYSYILLTNKNIITVISKIRSYYISTISRPTIKNLVKSEPVNTDSTNVSLSENESENKKTDSSEKSKSQYITAFVIIIIYIIIVILTTIIIVKRRRVKNRKLNFVSKDNNTNNLLLST